MAADANTVVVSCAVNASLDLAFPRNSTTGSPTSRDVVSEVAVAHLRSSLSFTSPVDEGGSGVFDASIVARQVRARQAVIKACHESELRSARGAGHMTMRFTIDAGGAVSNVHITANDTGGASLASCVQEQISRLRFNPGPDGGSVSFSFPFTFAIQR